ncbi:MAG TPA: hypothetical protein PLD10_11745 [Rhodopila sp.]|nr:hypothetical protein [Rhodopila sp.]
MTTGSALYLLMCIVAFGAVAIVLGYNTWQQGRMGGDFKTTPETQPESRAEVHA